MVHVWVTEPAAVQDPDLLQEYRALLNETERRKHDRYRLGTHRHAALLTRALVRTTLSRYCPEIGPAAWRFVESGNGRPEVERGQARLPLRFNLSRTEGLIACAVALDRAVGVDVEFLDRRRRTAAIVDRFFAPAERRALHALAADRQPERFYSYWTLKEAYVKARGLGLAMPLDQFAFDLEDADAIRVSCEAGLADDIAWQFLLGRPTPHHVLAVAVERREAEAVALQIRQVVPLRS